LKIIFAGTPHFAESALLALLNKKMEVVSVLTQPDRPSGRGMQLKASPVKQLAMKHGLTVLQPDSLKKEEIQDQLSKLEADVMIVAAYGLILPKAVLLIPKLGCFNIHASLLPRWRGAAPIQRAILAGDEQTGITIMQMDEGLDTGDMLLKKYCQIEEKETSDTLHNKLAELGAEAITEAVDLLSQKKLVPMKQENEQATYASKITKEEAQLDWNQTAIQLNRAIRSYKPFPGASTKINETNIKIWQASVIDENYGQPGVVTKVGNNTLTVSCGIGSLCLEILQRPNSKAMPIGQFLQGFKIKLGDRFEVAECI
jgi:methionyl-tRNA formyltransferase